MREPFHVARRKNKYGARPTPTVRIGGKLLVPASAGTDGYRFDSQADHRRYQELRILERAGKIMDLEVYPCYPLRVNGHLVSTYKPDFRYRMRDTGEVVVEDVKALDRRTGKKPTVTEAYQIRRKLVHVLYWVEVKEVYA